VITPRIAVDGADEVHLVQRIAEQEILPGTHTRIWGYDGTFPGPTLISRSGRPVRVTHTNRLPVPTVAHLHGGRTPPQHDGYPTDLLLPPDWPTGQGHSLPGTPGRSGMSRVQAQGMADPDANVARVTRTHTYPMQQRAATLWYHDHRMDFTGASVWRGLVGLHLIHDVEEDALPLPRGDRDLPLVVCDRAFGPDAELIYPSLDSHLLRPGVEEPYAGGVLGDVILVNGRPWPEAPVDAARHRLRILNASNARRYRLRLDPPPPDQHAFLQIGSDGGLLEAPVGLDAIEMAPAERFDVVVDFGRYPVGTRITLLNDFGVGSSRPVMRFHVVRRAADDTHVPARLSTIDWPDPAASAATRSFVFRNTGRSDGWTINGDPFSPTRMAATPRLGTTEIWRFVSDLHHPIHLHLVAMRVLGRGLDRAGPYDHGLKDTLDLRPAERAEVAIRFDGYRGRYVFHCHNLEHEDMTMMGNFATT
jgi:spore coat protein A